MNEKIRKWLTIKGHNKEVLQIRQTDDTLAQVIDSWLSTAVPLIIGLMAGLGIGIFLFSLQFSTLETVVVSIVLNFFVEYAMVRNYGCSIVGFAGAVLISFAMGIYQKEMKLALKYHKRQETASRTD
ncbi:MAG TPA: hypothetical protein VFW58_12160 [Trichococcus sp.]|nr:hypothetical protein [Trichococcus sp.]